MKNIEAILAENNIELTEEQRKAVNDAVTENYRTIADYNAQRDKYTTLDGQYKAVKAELDKFDGEDIDGLKRQIAEAKGRADKAEADAKAELAKRDYSDAVGKCVDTLTFSSAAAKKAFTADLIAKNLPLENGKLLGFADYVEAYKESDAGAIVDGEAAANRVKFTEPMHNAKKTANPREIEEENKMRAVMGLPPIGKEK